MHFSSLVAAILVASLGISSVSALPAVEGQNSGRNIPAPTPKDPYCFAKCSDQPDYVCAVNKKGQQKTFINPCQLGHYNCLFPKDTYTVVHEGACDNIDLPTP